MSRKALAAVVTAWLVLAVPCAALAQTSPFVDVPQDHWASQAIANLAAAGLVEGYPDGTFGGSRTLTRYEAAMVFSRMLARLEALLHQSVSDEVQGLSDQVAGDVSQRVMARATAEIQQSLAVAREQLARDLERMVAEQVAAQRVVERVVVEKQPQVTERVVVEQPRPFEMTPEVRQAIAEAVAQELPGALAEFREVDDAWRQGIKSEVAVTRADLADLRNRLNALGDQVQATTARLDGSLAALEGRVNTLGERVQATGSQVDRLEAGLADVGGRVDRLDSEMRAAAGRLDGSLADLQGRLNILDNEMQATASRLDALESTAGSLADRVTALENGSTDNFGQLFARTDAMERRLQSLSQASATQEDVTKLRAEIAAVRRNQTWLLVGIILAAAAGALIK